MSNYIFSVIVIESFLLVFFIGLGLFVDMGLWMAVNLKSAFISCLYLSKYMGECLQVILHCLCPLWLMISLKFIVFSSTKLTVEEWSNLGGLQVGGGINSDNCLSYIEEGASHVIVTSVSYISFLLHWVIQLLIRINVYPLRKHVSLNVYR